MLKRLALAGLLAAAAVPAQAASCSLTNAYLFKDGNFAPQLFASTILNPGDGNNPCRLVPWSLPVDAFGNAFSVSNGLPVINAGSAGTDFSFNALPVPMAGFTLLATVPGTPTRAEVEVQNQGPTTIQIVLDDGLGANLTSILNAPGAGDGAQGAGWSSMTFKGRVRVYGPSGARGAVHQN